MRPVSVIGDKDPLDALLDLAAAPAPGDDRRATVYEACLQGEMAAYAALGAAEQVQRCHARVVAAAHYRSAICDALNAPTRKAA